MSRKGVHAPGGSKSKKIPRIFQRWRSASPARLPGSSTDVVVSDRVNVFGVYQQQKKSCRNTGQVRPTDGTVRSTSTRNNNCYTPKVNSGSTEDAETVANIEKWLKIRTESVSSIDLDTIKAEVDEATDVDHRYLGDELPHAFLEKDPDVLSMDIDLSDKKLDLGYDPMLQDMRSDKLLEACEKDEYILPTFHLDHLDSLALAPDDMMVAGEILPSASNQTLNSSAISLGSTLISNHELNCRRRRSEERDLRHKGARGSSKHDCGDQPEAPSNSESDATAMGLTKRIVNVYVEAVGHVNVETNCPEPSEDPLVTELEEMSELKPKLRTKLEPRIIKKRRKPSSKDENGSSFTILKTEEQNRTSEGIMAVVAISTDKISNMTQIVINTGKEEQIYQGKTSELIEATGNFPQLSRIQSSCQENHATDLIADGSPSSEHDLLISNALEELGITDDTLEPILSTEHGKLWICPKEDCRRQFNRLYALKGHILSHYGVRPFKCDFKGCAWAFYSEFKLKRHKETHLKRKDYVCEVDNCGRRFTTVYNLLTHKKLHNRPSKIFCHVPNCQERFQTKRALELHMRSHDQSHAPYICKHEGCEKRYYSSNALTSHQRCHSYKEVDIKCSWPGCGKIFDKPCRLKAHIRSHTGYKPYLCTFQGCKWAFSSSSKLKRHQKKHTNERKFVCDVTSCGKAFMRSEHLKEHRLTHKDGRYFQCHMCDAKFSAKSSLYVHIKKHQTQDAISSLQSPMLIMQESESTVDQHQEYQSIIPNSEICENETSPRLELDLDLDPVIAGHPLAGAGDALPSPGRILTDPSMARVAYQCPIESCSKVYAAKSTLRAHLLKIHGKNNRNQAISNDSASEACVGTLSNVDYVTYETSPVSQPTDHVIMIAPHDALELEQSSLNSILKIPEVNDHDSVECIEQTVEDNRVQNRDGCARTNMTYNDFLRFRASNNIFNSVVGPTDVVLGAAGLVESLLLPEDLPSVYYQDDIAGTECQVLLLDSGPPESTINLRDLE